LAQLAPQDLGAVVAVVKVLRASRVLMDSKGHRALKAMMDSKGHRVLRAMMDLLVSLSLFAL
jgi:hypothetical protein